ncbi:Uncharacterised protein [Burkholderia pseudomallei]|nr:Uncharacterised protein [Burkholderia pseudomallei]
MNVKAGDLARVVRNGYQDPTPGIVDRIVEVARIASPGERYRSTCGRIFHVTDRLFDGRLIWVIRSASPLPWRVPNPDGVDRVLMFTERAIEDAYLRPIGGVPVTDDVEDEVPA